MSKQILFGASAQAKLVEGARLLEEAVGTTLGPLGRNAALDLGFEMRVVHDGVTVAREIESDDPSVNNGIRLVRQAANKQVEEVGDGTTVVTILANALIAECFKVTSSGVNPMELKRGLNDGAQIVATELSKLARPVKTLEEKINVATISAEEEDLGKMIAGIVDKTGADGVITVEKSKSTDTYVEHQEGMQFEGGFISPSFITDYKRNEATVEDTYLLLSDRVVSNIFDIKPLLDQIVSSGGRNFCIIAPDVTDSALASMILTKLNGGMNLLCAKAPLFGAMQRNFLEDLAILTGGRLISEASAEAFQNLKLADLGKCKRLTAKVDATLVVGGMGDKSAISERVESIKEQLERKEGSAFDQEKLRERIAKLTGGVAIIRVGGNTEVEMDERRERALDAVAATKAAVAEGILPGGEIAYLSARRALDTTAPAGRILYNALEMPFTRLLSNAGLNPGKYLAKLEDSDREGWGVDVASGEFGNLIEAGIIDPAKVAISAIKNAISVAIAVMTVSVLVTKLPEVKDNAR